MKRILTLALIASAGLFTSGSSFRKSKRIPAGYVYVPMGSVNVNGLVCTVQAFCMSATEVSNKQYREFLAALRKEGKTGELPACTPDSAQWAVYVKGELGEYFRDHYNSDPRFDDMPVVNVTQHAARLYCAWYTSAHLSDELVKMGADFRLPMEAEWTLAANGKFAGPIFPWGTLSPRKANGDLMANFCTVPEAGLKKDARTGAIEQVNVPFPAPGPVDKMNITAPVIAYWPNAFGLYNMSGNAAEMLHEDGRTKGGSWNSSGYYIRIDAADEYKGFVNGSPMIGFRPVITYLGPK
jgi:formylglycine-generating enzyme required for sulfatase activity